MKYKAHKKCTQCKKVKEAKYFLHGKFICKECRAEQEENNVKNS